MSQVDTQAVFVAADYLRYLSLMAIKRAASGHMGLPLGCAELGILLYRDVLRFAPSDPFWMNRDRFILSAGHGSVLLYVLGYLFGYPITLKDLSCFRQIDGILAGHPEYDIGRGIETTTGPLGQGFANAVGVALEGKMLMDRFNEPHETLLDYNVWTLAGDGCLMEGISYEAASLAGHLNLNNLIAIYDANEVTIDGSTRFVFSENIRLRFEAMGWHVDETYTGDVQTLHTKINDLKKSFSKPKLLIVRTQIGKGIERLEGSHHAHAGIPTEEDIVRFIEGSALRTLFIKKMNLSGSQEDFHEAIKEQLHTGMFLECEEIKQTLQERVSLKEENYKQWCEKYERYCEAYPEKASLLERMKHDTIPDELRIKLFSYRETNERRATRDMSAAVLNLCATYFPQIIGGAADLASSTKACIKSHDDNISLFVEPGNYRGRNIAFGIREHAMGAIGNGLALGGMLMPFTSTFFSFFDYMKPAVRLAAMMRLKHLFIFSHDSLYVGEDGPTHQPVEQLLSIRLIPNIHVFRPCNLVEVALSYMYYLEHQGPTAMITTRQKIRNPSSVLSSKSLRVSYEVFLKGAYVLTEDGGDLDVLLMGSGSEVELLCEAKELLNQKGIKVRIVSIPCMELFESAHASYRSEVLLSETSIPIIMCEAASYRSLLPLMGERVLLHTMNEFGVSGKAEDVAAKKGFTSYGICDIIERFLSKKASLNED